MVVHSYSMFSAVLPVRCLVPGGAWLPPPVLPPRLALPCIQITQRHLCTGGRRRHSKRLSQVGTFKIPFNYGVCPFVTVSHLLLLSVAKNSGLFFAVTPPANDRFSFGFNLRCKNIKISIFTKENIGNVYFIVQSFSYLF